MRIRPAFGIAAACLLLVQVAAAGPGSVGAPGKTPGPAQAGKPTEARKDAKKARAQILFAKGLKAYHEGRYKDAINSFLQAHHLFPSPVLSFNTARAYEKMSDDAGALRFYRAYLRQAPKARDRAKVQKRVGQLEAKLARNGVQQVTVMSEPDAATVIIDGRPVGVTPWTGEIYPGGHHLTLRLEGYKQATKDFKLPDLTAIDVNVKLEPKPAETPAPVAPAPAPPPPAPKPAPPPKPVSHNVRLPTWIAFGVGAVALGGAAVFEGLRRSSVNLVKTDTTQLGRASAYHSAKNDQTTARVLAGVGGAALVVGGVLLYIDLSRGGSEKSERVGLGCSPGGCGATLGGRW